MTQQMTAEEFKGRRNRFAKGRTVRRAPGVMNKTEAEYAKLLDERVQRGEILEYWFEGVTLRLADMCRLTPDFFVMLADGVCEIHEVKGFFEGDALVKMKVCAAMYPFRVIAVSKRAKKDGGGWNIREFSAMDVTIEVLG